MLCLWMQVKMKMLLNAVFLNFLFISGVSACHQAESLKTDLKRSLEALNGSCLLIPCKFEVTSTRFTGRPAGSWLKGSPNFDGTRQNFVYSTNKQHNNYSMEFIGNLKEGNCSTIFSDVVKSYADNYYFRIESGEYNATAACDNLNITVLDSPPSPTLDVSGELKENSSVTLSCSAVTPCPRAPPTLSWNYTEEPATTTDRSADQILVTKIQKNITLSDKHDGLSIKCSAEYPVTGIVKRAEGNFVLNVTYSPKTSVSIPAGSVPAGSSVSLTCLSRANPPASQFAWFLRGSDGATEVSRSQNYTVSNVTHTVVLFCVARNALGEGTSDEIQLRVSKQFYWIIVGAIIGFIMLVCLFICVWKLQSRVQTHRRSQSKPRGGQKIHISEGSASALHEEVHYGEIEFSKRNVGQTAVAVDHESQQQDTVYAEVRVPDSSPGATQTVADIPGDLDAQVT